MKINNIVAGINSFQNVKHIKNAAILKQNYNQKQCNLNLQSTNSIPFHGNAQRITDAYIVTGEEKDLPLLITKKNNSYVVEFDSQTEIIYGIDAINYLDKTDYFEYDTQIIFPKKSSGEVVLENGKTIDVKENNAILLSADTKAKIKTNKGYPMLIISKKDFDWYERHSNDAKNENIKNKFLELMYYNSHLYNGEFTPNILLPEKMLEEDYLKQIGINKWETRNGLINAIFDKKDLLNEEDKKIIEERKKLFDKLFSSGLAVQKDDGYVKFEKMPIWEYEATLLKKNNFSDEEIRILKPILKQARQVYIDTKIVNKNQLKDYNPTLVEKMKEKGLLFENKKDANEFIYWCEFYGNEESLRKTLEKNNFSIDEQTEIIKSWKKSNLTGFDASGLKFINENIAVYDLNDKLNNWTHEKTNWVTNSTALATSTGKAPFIGTSLVQNDEKRTIAMGEIRKEEKLHAHPNLEEKRQTEIYLITSGAAALNVVKNGKSGVKILKEGELVVVGPGVQHCVNSILGEYEHIVSQIPSAFQYGFSFKSIVEPPIDYNEEELKKEAYDSLEKLRV